MRVMMTRDGFIENNRRRQGHDPAKHSFKLESLENFNPRVMVIVKTTAEELKELDAIAQRRRDEKGKPRQGQTAVERAPEIRFYKKEEFADEAETEDQTSDVKAEPSQYPMKKDKPKSKKKAAEDPTGDEQVI